MSACTFFGHRDCTESIKPKLRETLIDLIENHEVNMFYVGNHGQFDAIVRGTLKELKAAYPHIDYAVVLAYLPGKGTGHMDYSETMLPEGIEKVHPRFAISWRNKWMLKHSDYVIGAVSHSWGGATQFVEMAERQKKQVIKL